MLTFSNVVNGLFSIPVEESCISENGKENTTKLQKQ